MNDLLRFLTPIVEKEGIENAKIEITGKNNKGEGYLGIVSAAEIIGSNKTLKVVIKTALPSEEVRKQCPLKSCYVTEINFYNKIYPILRECQLECGDIKPFMTIAKCYETSLKDFGEGLVMENLKEAGYSVCERRKVMPKEHVRLALEEYGRFHAMSYALKEKHPKLFKEITDSMEDNFLRFLYNPDFKSAFDGILQKIIDYPKIKSNASVSKALQKCKDSFMTYFRNTKPKYADKFSVITHGDCWTNNMMFKYDDVKNPFIPTSLIFIDWQLQKVGSPALDISYFLYACTGKSTYDILDEYLKIYHNSLVAQLTKLGCEKNHLTFSELKDQYRVHAKYGLIFSFMVIKLMLSDADEVPDLADMVEDPNSNPLKHFDFECKSEDQYRDRVVDLAFHAHKYKII